MKQITVYINNKDDINKLYKKLNWYKLFKNKSLLKLKINNNIDTDTKEELKSIQKAFNIKDKYKRLVYVYNYMCSFQDKYINKNICEFDNGICISQRNNKCRIHINGCCGSCTYLGKKGCTINSISCKLFYCNYIKKIKEVPDYKKLKVYKYFLSFWQKQIIKTNFFTSFEDNINMLYKANLFTWLFFKDKKMDRKKTP